MKVGLKGVHFYETKKKTISKRSKTDNFHRIDKPCNFPKAYIITHILTNITTEAKLG